MSNNKKEIAENKYTNRILEEILNNMEEMVNKASTIPLTNKIVVEKDYILEYINEIRVNYPAEMKTANYVKSERERILDEAQNMAEKIKQNAKDEALRLIEENQITQQAYQRAEEINAGVQEYYINTCQSAYDFAEDIFSNLETRLSKLNELVRQEHADYRQSIDEKNN